MNPPARTLQQRGPTSPTWVAAHGPGGTLRRFLALSIPLLLLTGLAARLGAHPFAQSLHVLTPTTIATALLLGAVTTTAQAMRWRIIAIAYGSASRLTRRRAIQECYRSALLKTVLPFGVLGDVARAWRQRPAAHPGPQKEAQSPRPTAEAVILERVIGTTLLLTAAAAATFSLQPELALLFVAGSGLAAVIAARGLGPVTPTGRLAAVGLTLLILASLVTKFSVASASLGTVHDPRKVITLALIVLAAMSLPINLAGFGPREAVAALAFASIGLSADSGVETAAAYGVLAAVSTAPGALVMVLAACRNAGGARSRNWHVPRPKNGGTAQLHNPGHVTSPFLGDGRPRGCQIQLGTQVVTEHKPASGSAQRVRDPI